jgi:hypothetical protein
MKKYYFIYYSCYRINWPKNFPVNSNPTYNQGIIDIHPIKWQLETNKEYDKEMPLGDGKYSENYKIISWQELSKKEYDEFEGWVG